MAVLRYLNVELRLMAENFNNGVKASQKEMKEFEKTIRPSKDLLEGLGKAATVAGGALVGAFALAVKSAADYGDEMNDASKRTGITTENLSKLRLAAETSGTSFEGLSTGLKFLGKNMELAVAGGKEQTAAFKAAGITSKDLAAAHGDVNSILNRLADTFAGSTEDAAKTTLSMQLLGKSGTDLIPLLNEGSSGLKKWGDEAERTGRVVSADAAKAADEFNDRLRVLTASVEGLVGSIAAQFIPALTEWINKGSSVVQQVREWTAANKGLSEGLAVTGGLLLGTGGILLGVVGLTKALPTLAGAWRALTGTMTLSTAGLAAALAGIIYFRKEIAEGLMGALATAVQGLEKFTGFAADLADKIGLGGLASKLHDASFSAGTFRRELDAGVATLMLEGMEIPKTSGLLAAEEAARNNAAAATAKHRIELEKNTEELEKQKKAAEELKKFWEKALADFKNETFSGGAEAKAGLEEADRTAKAIVKSYEDLLKLEQEAGDAFIKNTEFWNTQLQIFRDGAQSVKDDVKAGEDAAAATAKKIIDKHKEYLDQIKKDNQAAVEDVKRSAGKIFDDMFIKGQSVFSSLKNALKGGALSLGRAIFEDIAGTLLGPVKKAFDDFFKSILEGAGVKSLITGLGQKLGGVLGSVFGGGGGASGAASIATGVIGPRGASTAAGGLASAGSSLTGSFIQAGASIAGGLISAIGSMRLEGTMNAVEKNTRYLSIDFENTMNQILWPIAGHVGAMRDQNQMQINQLDAIYKKLGSTSSVSVAGLSSAAIQMFSTAAQKFSDSINKLIPAPASAAATNIGPISIEINVELKSTVMASADTREVRDNILPKLLIAIKNGVGSSREELTRIILDSMRGLSSTKVPA